MEKRKNPEKELRSKSGLFFQIGLLIAMMLCVSAFEYRTKEFKIQIPDFDTMQSEDFLPPITEINPPTPPKPKTVKIVVVPEDEPEPEEPKVEFDQMEPPTIIPQVEEPPIEVAPEGEFTYVEEMPSPKGGYESFYNFISKNLTYPNKAIRGNIEGKVFVQFVVNENGELVDIEIARGIGSGCDEEVLRIMQKAPKWNPGKQRGVPVRVKTMMPISFQLN